MDVLFHITQGEQAHVGEVKVTGFLGPYFAQVQKIAHLDRGDRITVARVSGVVSTAAQEIPEAESGVIPGFDCGAEIPGGEPMP